MGLMLTQEFYNKVRFKPHEPAAYVIREGARTLKKLFPRIFSLRASVEFFYPLTLESSWLL